DLLRRGEAEALAGIVALERLVDGGIECPVPVADLLVDDRPDLPRPRVRREIALLVAELHRQAHAHGPVPRFRDACARPDVVADPLPARVRLDAREQVEAGLEPLGEP